MALDPRFRGGERSKLRDAPCPLMPAKAGIQYLVKALDPRFRGVSGASCALATHPYRYCFKIRSASACASFIACSAVLVPVNAACSPSLSALVTRWFSWVESSATANLS